jgi:RNA polymerase sigma-70 factor (ECF subfamily)
MARIARGDEAAFRALVARWEQIVFAFLYHMVGSRQDAEDLGQEVFLRLYVRADRYEPRGRFRSWLLRIAGNLARSWLRRQRLLRWLPFQVSRHQQADPALSAEQRLARQEVRRAVRAALDRLPVRQRQAVVLRRYQELGYDEIARIMGTTRPGVESLLRRAAEGLRRELAGLRPDEVAMQAEPSGPEVES